METEAPDVTDVIDSVPTNVCGRSAIGAGARSGDGRCGVETLSSRVDGERFDLGRIVDGVAPTAVGVGAIIRTDDAASVDRSPRPHRLGGS